MDDPWLMSLAQRQLKNVGGMLLDIKLKPLIVIGFAINVKAHGWAIPEDFYLVNGIGHQTKNVTNIQNLFPHPLKFVR
jgi:hypothetical protein